MTNNQAGDRPRRSGNYLRDSFKISARVRAGLVPLLLGAVLADASAQDRVRIAPLGNTVELKLETTAPQQEYVLESQAKLMEGEEWAPLMQFRGAKTARSYVDAVCSSSEARFFRLRQLLSAPPAEVSNFRLLDTAGNAHELYYKKPAGAVILVLSGTNLPAALTLSGELEQIRKDSGGAQLPIWIISASDHGEREKVAAMAAASAGGSVVLQDASHAVHKTLGTGRTPEAVLVSTADWSIAYRGSVEETIDTGAGVVRNRRLANAVSDFLAGRPVDVSRTAPIGEPAGLRPVPHGEYRTHIAPMLLKSCMPCHMPGDIAPWSMTNHAVISTFSKIMKSAVLAGEMPPWHADPKHQKFVNSKALAPEEVAMLVDWIDRGAPRGSGEDPLESSVVPSEPDWPLGKPDAIITIDPQEVPANGEVDYRYLYAQNPFPNDVWLRAVSIKPGERSVVHHCLVFKGNLTELIALRGGLGGFFAGYVPGMEQVAFPQGTGKLLRKSDVIVFQMHYTVSGKATTDRTQMGLYLAPARPEKELVTGAAATTSFVIPPNNPAVPVSAFKTFAKKSILYEFSPHMHFRGANSRFTLIYPNGDREVVLNVPSYFFNWQALYRLEKPKEVPAGTRLLCEGNFDNSPQNRFNPDPNQVVRFGEQSWEEMFIGYINYTETP